MVDKDSVVQHFNALVVRLAELQSKRDEMRRSLHADPIDHGDTAWMISATSLVLSMTLPGLALYYSGMVRVRNVLATLMQVFTITCLVTMLWMLVGYSLAFGPADSGASSTSIFGDGSRLWLDGMSKSSTHQVAPTVPEPIFCAYQLTFAIITPALICGSFADRMKYEAMLLFMAMWHVAVYCPLAHIHWHPDGFLFKAGSLDYAGGDVVHISSGIASLVSAIMLGYRKGFGVDRFDPHNIVFSFLGACLMWVGWFGFNAGSAYKADGRASMAFLVTQICAAMAALSWLTVEWVLKGKPSVLGMISGAFSGLVCITPAAGFVDPSAAFVIGIYGGPLCYFGCQLKHIFGFDDALDAFGIHAVGGIVGTISTGFFAVEYIGDEDGVYYAGLNDGGNRLAKQLYAIVVTIGWSAVTTYLILQIVEWTIGLRVKEEDELAGLDVALHGESIEPVSRFVPTLKPDFKHSDYKPVAPPSAESAEPEVENDDNAL
jgi:Amt family ammonium transporter